MEAGGKKGSSTFREMLTQPWSRCVIPEVALVCSQLGKEPFFFLSHGSSNGCSQIAWIKCWDGMSDVPSHSLLKGIT